MRKMMLSGALVMAAASLFAIGANATSADAAPAAGKAEYSNEELKVYEESSTETPYQFYTTTKVTATSIPKNNKWTKFDGTLDLSGYAGKTTFYFSMSPNPSSWKEVLEVTVPAKPTLKGLKYAAGGTDAKAMLVGASAQVSNGSKDKFIISDAALLSANDETLTDIFEDSIATYQATGTTLSVVYKNQGTLAYNAEAEETTVTSKNVTTPTGHYVVTLKGTEGNGTYLRPSKPCNLKITKAAAAPAVTIDYANATMTMKNNMGYLYNANGNYNNLKRETADGWKTFTAQEKVALQKGVYAVATGTGKARSQLTYISVPEPQAFTAANGKVTVVGSKLEEKNKNKKAVVTFGNGKDAMTYQYRVVQDASACFKDGVYDSQTVDAVTEKGKKAQVWTNVKVTAGYKSVTFANTAHAGKDILVRVAAGTNTFASQIMVLEQPDNDGDGWKVYAQGDSANAKQGVVFGEASYNAGTKTITVPLSGEVIATNPSAELKEKCTVTYSKKTESATDITVSSSAITLKLPASDNFSAINNKAVTVTIPEGMVKDGNSNAVPAQVITVTVDNVAPKATAVKAAQKSGTTTITLTVDSQIKAQVTTTTGEGDDAVTTKEIVSAASKAVAIDASNITLSTVSKDDVTKKIDPTEVTFKLASGKTTITITTPTTAIADMIKSYTIALSSSVTDIIGNSVDMGDKATVANPSYNADAKAATVTASISAITNGEATVTVKTADAATLAITPADYEAALQAVNSGSGITISDVKMASKNKAFTFKVSGLTNTDTADKTVTLTLPSFKDSNGFDITPTLDAIVIPGVTVAPEEPDTAA